MKKKTIFASVVLMVIVLTGNVRATDVGGIIDVDTTWSLANSPYTVTSEVQIAEGVALTIEPGVVINKAPDVEYGIKVWGTLDAVGTDESRIVFNAVYIEGGDSQTFSLINLNFCEVNHGSIRGYCNLGSFILQDSILKHTGTLDLRYPQDDCYVERNIFDHTGKVWTGIGAEHKVYVRNNVFYNQDNYAVRNDGCGSNSELIVKYNSFLSTDRIALKLQSSGSMTATENYWNTTETSIIDSMIYDRNDDLGISNYIVYDPILAEPHPNTPVFLPDQILTIQAEPNDANTVTPSVGQHICSGLVDISAEPFIDCPDVYQFNRWIGDVADANSANTTVFMDSDKTIKAVFVATRECGDECHPNDLFGDYNHDCIIDFTDFAAFADNWLVCTKPECE